MRFRKLAVGFCASWGLTAAGLVTQSLAAGSPRDSMPVKFDAATWHHEMCSEHYARAVGRLAYLDARLSLTPSQRPLFENWKQAVLGGAKAHESACLSHQPDFTRVPSIVERTQWMEAMLQARLSEMTAQQPSLKAFYEVLNPEQKMVLDRAAGGGEDDGWGGGPRGPGGHENPYGHDHEVGAAPDEVE